MRKKSEGKIEKGGKIGALRSATAASQLREWTNEQHTKHVIAKQWVTRLFFAHCAAQFVVYKQKLPASHTHTNTKYTAHIGEWSPRSKIHEWNFIYSSVTQMHINKLYKWYNILLLFTHKYIKIILFILFYVLLICIVFFFILFLFVFVYDFVFSQPLALLRLTWSLLNSFLSFFLLLSTTIFLVVVWAI